MGLNIGSVRFDIFSSHMDRAASGDLSVWPATYFAMNEPMDEPPQSAASTEMLFANDDMLLENQLSFVLYATSNRMARLYNVILKDLQITYPQFLCLMVLWETSPLTFGALSKKLEMETGTLTPLLKRMQANGLISQSRDAKDGRRVVVTILDRGLMLKSSIREARNKAASALHLDAEVVADLRKSLQKFARHMSHG